MIIGILEKQIRQRLRNINMKNVELIIELEAEGLKVTPPELSAYLHGELNYRKKREVLAKADEIIKRHELSQS